MIKRRNHCEGKRRYPNRAAALGFIKRHQLPQRPYRCKYCNHWHTGTSQYGKFSRIQKIIDEVVGEGKK